MDTGYILIFRFHICTLYIHLALGTRTRKSHFAHTHLAMYHFHSPHDLTPKQHSQFHFDGRNRHISFSHFAPSHEIILQPQFFFITFFISLFVYCTAFFQVQVCASCNFPNVKNFLSCVGPKGNDFCAVQPWFIILQWTWMSCSYFSLLL